MMWDIRWKQRYSNYSNMLGILDKNLRNSENSGDFLETFQIALAKTFELCFELMWKLLREYGEYREVEFGLISPKSVLRTVAESGLLEEIGADGDVLMQMHTTRNELIHVYDQKGFSAAVALVEEAFFPQMQKIDKYFKGLLDEAK